MARSEQESHLMSPVTIKRPTVLDLSRLLETQRINSEISITCLSETRKTTLFDVIGRDRTDQILKALEELDPFTKLPGTITFHRSPKNNMADPENRQLHIFGNGEIMEIGIIPPIFSKGALRKIACDQIFTRGQTEILIEQNGKRDLISREELTNTRELLSEDRNKFLDALAVRMQKGDQVIIRAVVNKAKERDGVFPDITAGSLTYEEIRDVFLQQLKNGGKVIAEWYGLDGKSQVTATIDLSSPQRTIEEIEELSQAFTGAHRLSIK